MTSSAYHQIQIEERHRELVDRHKELICKMYGLPEDIRFKVLNVEEKIPDGSGLFYKLTIMDGAGRTYVVKIDKPKPMQLDA